MYCSNQNKWEEINMKTGWLTPGGESLYRCPQCGEDEHLYGVENLDNWHHECKNCKAKLVYPWEEEIK